jgi:2-polyprenyl-6-hydroxyphenyl methylase/3-demethylubiquinone-9 3-methyltransferase
MWQALGNVIGLVHDDGILSISIYNDQEDYSRYWRRIKALYNKGPLAKAFVVSIFIPGFILRGLLVDLARLKSPLQRYFDYKKTRGMSVFYDWFDWLGGYPFEVAKPEEVFDFYRNRGFVLVRLKTCGYGHGCNEFVFCKRCTASSS